MPVCCGLLNRHVVHNSLYAYCQIDYYLQHASLCIHTCISQCYPDSSSNSNSSSSSSSTGSSSNTGNSYSSCFCHRMQIANHNFLRWRCYQPAISWWCIPLCLLCAYMAVSLLSCYYDCMHLLCLACILNVSSTLHVVLYCWHQAHFKTCSRFIMFVAITQKCPGLSLGALCVTILALVSIAGGFDTIRTRRQMRSQCEWCYRSSRSRVIVCFVPGVGSCLCLQDASTDLKPYTRPFVSLVFQVYTLDHPLVDLHAFSLGSWPAAFPRLDFRRFDCKAAFSTQHSSLEGLTARCMAMHFMPTSWAPCFVSRCALTLIPSFHQACSLVQVWEPFFGFIPKKIWKCRYIYMCDSDHIQIPVFPLIM